MSDGRRDIDKFEDFKQNDSYKVMTTYYPNEVLSGSISLYLHGIIDFREFNDLDIIVDDRRKVSDYAPMSDSKVDNYIGHKYISIQPIQPNYRFFKRLFGPISLNKIKVDFFENKHIEDLERIFSSFSS